GGFPWLDMPQYANENWYNAHNFYGDLEDLDAATLEDVKQFFDTYYSPNNAVLVVVGDFEESDAKKFIEQYFADIPSATLPEQPDISEPRQTAEKRFVKEDKLANKPALAVAYHMPEKGSPAYYAMGLIDQILLQGDDAWLHQELVQDRGLTGDVSGGINLLGNMFNYNGPMLWMADLIYDKETAADSVLNAIDQSIAKLQNEPVDQELLDLAMVKMRSNLYDNISGMYGFGTADLLASFALFDDKPEKINEIEGEFKKVTPALIQQTAREYLQPRNRTILIVDAQAPAN
ncbi:MAG: insulinase family protein, partial [Bacteroidetes bacterium]|nr:insulinase family protein [Bacteroidota bacterium]